MENSINQEAFENNGSVNISDEVVAVIASQAASSVEGVYEMVSGLSDGFVELLGKKSYSKGVKITKDEDGKLVLDLGITVLYGARIPDVTWEVQSKVKSEIEAMTNLEVKTVNIEVSGIKIPDSNKQEAEETKETKEEESKKKKSVTKKKKEAEPEKEEGSEQK